MKDQSFNVENFLKVYYDENRKGNYVEGGFEAFKKVRERSDSIVQINKRFREKTIQYRRKLVTKEAFQIFKQINNSYKDWLINDKHCQLEIALSGIEKKIYQNDFSIELDDSLTIGGKTVYTVDRSEPEIFFLLKQLQKNIQRAFKVKQSDRFEVVNQVANLLDDNFPKYVIRTDIKSFFESIPHDKLKALIRQNHFLSPFSKKIIFHILHDYATKAGKDRGIPRGIGISAYLAELYMRDIDSSIKSLENVTYYARYVDDIILIITPKTKYEKVRHLTLIKLLMRKWGLKINQNKTKSMDLALLENQHASMDFLGYEFKFSNQKDDIKIQFTQAKLNRIKEKVDLAIEDYNSESKYNECKARKLLVKRLQFMTGNTRLLNVKKNILVGIYFSNTLLTDTSQLQGLDHYLTAKINSNINPYTSLTHIDQNRLKKRLKKFSFKKGFEEKLFSQFSSNELHQIMKIWKTV